MMNATIITLTLFVVTVTLWILWRKRRLSLFKRLNIPGPEPSLFLGNSRDLLHKGQHNCIEQWIKEYGKVFGYYFGVKPVLVVADLELLRTIQLKEFHKFPNRPLLFQLERARRYIHQASITSARSDKWKYMRSIITPTFTTAKLKMMNPITMNAVNELYEAVEKESTNGKAFDIYQLYQNLTMDVIARTALGIHTKAQADKNEPLVKLSSLIFSVSLNTFLMLAFSFTEFTPVFVRVMRKMMSKKNDGKNPRVELEERTSAAIALRRKDPDSRRRDLLQLLMDAQRTEENISDSSLTAVENDDQVSNTTSKQPLTKGGRKLNDQEVLQNSLTFLLAGYETTSTALAYVTYILSHNQNIQEKVREEIRNNITDCDKISYEDIQKLPYLDQVINETLRVHPPVTYFVMRQAAEDSVVEGIHIPKEVTIQIPVYHLHHDPTVWDNPEKFDPERFTPEAKASRHPMAFQPFGAGPRNCVGMRFALTEMKMALSKLLYNYKFLPTEEELKIHHTLIIDRPKGIRIKAVKV